MMINHGQSLCKHALKREETSTAALFLIHLFTERNLLSFCSTHLLVCNFIKAKTLFFFKT